MFLIIIWQYKFKIIIQNYKYFEKNILDLKNKYYII